MAFLLLLYVFLFMAASAAWRTVRTRGPEREYMPAPGPDMGEGPPTKELVLIDPARDPRPSGTRIALTPEATVGRAPGNLVVLEEDTVSSRHAVFHVQGKQWSVEDLNSTNGTFVNGQRIRGQVRLRDGDEVLFGRVATRFTPVHANVGRR